MKKLSTTALSQQIRRYWIMMPGVCCHLEPFGYSCPQLSSLHDPGYPVFRYDPAIYPKLFCDPGASIGLIALFEDIHDLDQQLFVFLPASRRTAAKPFVITGSARSSLRNRAFSFSRSVILGFPLPGKLLFSYLWYSLLQRYNNSARIPNSSAISRALPLTNESSTAFCLNSRSYFYLSFVIMVIYYFL